LDIVCKVKVEVLPDLHLHGDYWPDVQVSRAVSDVGHTTVVHGELHKA